MPEISAVPAYNPSMTSGASEKKIVPHSMFHNDLKTYVRCYDLGRRKFLDLVVGRIQEIFGDEGSAPAECLREFDDDWNTYLSLELVVHPRVQHKKAIESDMQTIFEQADILSLHIPLTEETQHLVKDSF